MTNTNETKVVKVTKIEKFAKVIEVLESSNHADKVMLIEAMQHEIELLEKKKSSKSSKTNPMTEQLKEIIVETLRGLGKPATITELMQANESLQEYEGTTITNQRVSRLANDLTKAGILVKTVDKKKSYFTVA